MAAMLIKCERKVPLKAMGTGFRRNVRFIPTARTECGASVGGMRALPSMPAGGALHHGTAAEGDRAKVGAAGGMCAPSPPIAASRPSVATTHSRKAKQNPSRKMIAGPRTVITGPRTVITGSETINCRGQSIITQQFIKQV